jgi:hypothetical protein
MTKEEQQTKTGMLSSRFWRAFVITIAAIFVFGGSYLTYVLAHVLKVDIAISITSGFILFIIGLAAILYLVRSKVIS